MFKQLFTVGFGLGYVFNGISILYGLFNAEIWLIYKYVV